jgi:predicted RND superfamily exporter protein
LIELDDNFLTYFDDSFEFRRATDFLIKNLGGWDSIEYSLDSGQSGGISDPEYLGTVDRFAAWCRQQPKVIRVATVVDTIKRLNRDMHGGDERYYRIPDQRELAAQYLLFYELSLPFGQDLNSQIDVDKSCTRLTVVLESMSAKELCHMDEVARQWLQANAPRHMRAGGTGPSLIWARITQRNIGSMLLASLGEIVLISCIMIVAIRSLKFVVLFLIPNLVPPFVAFGIWGMIKGQVGLALSVVVAMTLGIIVDDTIHFFVTYFRARREEAMNPEQAVRHAFATVGSAIGITTLVLVSGFLVLTLSHYKMIAEMGMMCTMVIGLALFVEFFLSPTLLMKFDRAPDRLTGDTDGRKGASQE